MKDLIIRGILIKRNAGLYRLSDLHRASGSAKRDRPSRWLKTKRARNLLHGLGMGEEFAELLREGADTTTHVSKILLIAYAFYLSPSLAKEVLNESINIEK